MSRRVNVRGIIVKDGKLFAVRHYNEDGSIRDAWCTPGGGLDDGETLHEGIRREMLEETGVEPVIGKLLWIYQFKRSQPVAGKGSECLEFFFHITNADDYTMIDLSKSTHGLQEIAEVAFVNPKEVAFKPAHMQTIDLDELLNAPEPLMTSTLLEN